jgi:hypothetical protein
VVKGRLLVWSWSGVHSALLPHASLPPPPPQLLLLLLLLLLLFLLLVEEGLAVTVGVVAAPCWCASELGLRFFEALLTVCEPSTPPSVSTCFVVGKATTTSCRRQRHVVGNALKKAVGGSENRRHTQEQT